MKISKEPTRKATCFYDDNGKPHFRSTLSPENVKVRAECQPQPHYPGIIIFVHGVNSTGEWFASAEKNICEGLNTRLGLEGTPYMLKYNQYNCDDPSDSENYKKDRKLLNAGNSPVVRFYWGYRSAAGDEDRYLIPLVNRQNEDYRALKKQGLKPEALQAKGLWFWGGGPFQNGTNNLVSLWGETGFNETLRYVPIKVQDFAPDFDRLLTSAPPRKYYAHAVKRLADLLDLIRKEYPRDTVSIISHSQGTMIALAATALAKKASDALFILNSPYAMETKAADNFSLPDHEIISDKAREQTLEAIINKVAQRAQTLPAEKYNALFVGKSVDNKSWTPLIKHKSTQRQITKVETGEYNYVPSGHEYPAAKKQAYTQTVTSDRWIPERDNHGRFYIYCNPHDRVMGSSPLLSLGWQGLPNTSKQEPHKLITGHKKHLFQRMMARATPCGTAPNPKTPFWPLPDGKPFWDDGGDFLTYNTPNFQTIDINAEEVPDPIAAFDMADFDKTRSGDGEHWDKHPKSRIGLAWGQYDKKTNLPNDDTFENYVLMYPKIQVPTGKYRPTGRDYPKVEPELRLETDEEHRIRVGSYISQPTDHSTLPNSPKFMQQVAAFDLPVGFCDATWNKAFMAELRARADWTKGYDSYFNKGELSIPPIPSIISTEPYWKRKQGH